MARRKRRKIHIGRVIMVLLCLCIAFSAGMLLMRRAFEEPEVIEPVIVRSKLKIHEYHWENLHHDDPFLSYEDEQYTSLQGIDVSVHNREIDWKKVADQGIDFVMIRVGYRGYTEGRMYDDDLFEANIRGALENGLDVGIYYFSQAVNTEEALAEARYTVKKIKEYNITYPVVFDMESPENGDIGRTTYLSREERTKNAMVFLEYVRDAGYEPMIYDSSLLFEEEYDLEGLTKYKTWVADYAGYPKYDYVFDIWQYTSSAALDGIDEPVDMNILFVRK